MKRITVMNKYETNLHHDEIGGYHQPLYEFNIEGVPYIYHDTSCGKYGTRRRIEKNGHLIYNFTTMAQFENYYDYDEAETIALIAKHFAFNPMFHEMVKV